MRYLLLLTLIAGCSEPKLDPPKPPPPPPPPDTPSFTARTGSAPSLHLEGSFEEESLTVEMWADDLGPIFGLAGHVLFDPTHLAVESAELAPELLPDAAELIRTDPDRVVFGVARRGAALGDAPLDGAVLLATVRFSALRGGDSELLISHAMVRRSDGSVLPAALLGADVHTVGGAP